MLTLTENASTIISDLTGQPGLPDSAGLRITADQPAPEPGQAESFAIAQADHAMADDQVVEQAGATLFLDPTAAAVLDDKVLDAAVDQEGRVEFALAFQG